MTPPKFDYFAPTSIQEACRLLSEKGPDARVMAGGTDLMVKIRQGMAYPKAVIGLRRVAELAGISFDSRKGLTIDAMARLADVAGHPDIVEHYPAVSYAAGETANVQIRNMGTVAGNLCNAAPSADNAPALMALGAEALIASGRGERRLSLDEFFAAPGSTLLEPGEILTGVAVPPPLPNSGASYQHVSPRGKVDISAVGIGAFVVMEGKTCRQVRIVMGAVAPTPVHAGAAESLLEGKELTPALIDQAAEEASREAKPITDVRASAAYRSMMITVLTRRALKEAGDRAAS